MSAEVEDVPRIMRSRGWNEGADILQRWFSLPSNSVPTDGVPDFSTITMAWVRGFARGDKAVTDAIRDRIWTTDNAKGFIMKTLAKRGKLTQGTNTFYFDNINNANPTTFPQNDWEAVDDDYVTSVNVGSQGDPLDGMKAALGRWNLRFLVSGTVVVAGPNATVTVQRVGYYVRDSFDFNDSSTWYSQPLGFWNSRDNGVQELTWPWEYFNCYTERQTGSIFQAFGSRTPPGLPAGYGAITIDVPQCEMYSRLTNESFRDYRTRTGNGGDFLIFSNIQSHQTNDTFAFTEPPGGWRTLLS